MKSFASFVALATASASLVAAAPAPIPNGGVGVRYNDTPPVYHTLTDFDFQSLNLALNQEWIELDLFNYGVARFSEEEFAAQGLGPDDISLINFMANQEVGHSTLLTNILSAYGRTPAKRCQYQYDFNSVPEFVQFCQQLTRWGESGVYGFLSHLDSRPSASLLLQSITTEARQQMIFRQFAGAHPMPVYFETGISQSMAWSLLSRYIVSCPAENPHVQWQNFPLINVTNDQSLVQDGYLANITHNRTSLTEAGRNVTLQWEAPGMTVSYNGTYNTTVGGNVTDLVPKYVAWISQLNTTYTPLTAITNNTGYTTQPGGYLYNGTTDSVQNGTMFLALTSENPYVTPYNLSLLNDVIIAFGLVQVD